MSRNFDSDDAALAKALQEEYEREYRRRSMQQHLGTDANGYYNSPRTASAPVQPTAPSAAEVFGDPFYEPGAPPEPEFVMSAEDPSFGGVEMSDELYARRLEQEMIQEQIDHRQTRRSISAPPKEGSFQRPTPSRSNSQSRRGAPHSAPHSAPRASFEAPQPPPLMMGRVLSDEEVAQRLQQEQRDAEIARQVVAQEQMRRSEISAQAMQNEPNRRGCCFVVRRCLSCFMTLILVVVAIVLFVFFFGGDSPVGNFIPDPDRFREEDPFNSANPADANLWRTKSPGLRLTVINALSSEWHDHFYTAIGQWDSGTPDTLELTTQVAQPELVCSSVDGKVKVCNGDYGETNWRGINKVMLEKGYIYSSAARMNEYYVRGEDREQRQYTMCHELGHAWGLPHTDENFFNKDLLNCMDYTNRPENNMQPAEPNFLFLEELYGRLDGSTVQSSETVPAEDKRNRDNGGKNKNDRVLRRGLREVPEAVVEAFDALDALIDNGNIATGGWRKLHQSEYGQTHEVDLGDGFSAQIHLLSP